MRLPLSLLALPALLAAAPAEEPALARGCGTARVVQAWVDAGKIGGTPGFAARTAAVGLRGRTLFTEHFALHYSVNKSVHQVAWSPADSALRRLRDSLYTAFAAADPALRDSLLHDRLDSLEAPHPLYIQVAAQQFERAHAYYADTLGMRMPGTNRSRHFGRPSQGRFSVDVLDITATTGETETYGLTYPPEGSLASPLLLENDFLYNASVTPSGTVIGTPIVARFNGAILRDYGVDWESGLAVTVPHEYYHAVQFTYTPPALLSGGYHAWYELSAIGMEERLSPAVNDYLQYLHHVIPASGNVSLLTRPPSLRNYGSGIFHIYLSHAVGNDFDVAVWERLRNNANSLEDALVTAFGSEARWDSLYTAYAAALAISGRPDAGASPLAFSPDMSLWPRPAFDSAQAQPAPPVPLPPLTFRLIRPPGTGTTWASLPGMRGGWRLTESGTTYSAQFLPDSLLPVTAGAFAVTVVNASPTASKLMKLSRAPGGLSAYPNPARAGGTVSFAPAEGASASLLVVSESGRRVASLDAGSAGSWSWDLRDAQGRPVPPGVYYYGLPGQAPKSLLLLP